MLKLFAIYLPHITEEIYQAYFREIEGEKSIHLTQLTPIDEEIDAETVENGDEVAQIVSKIRAFKSENNLSLKEELSKVTLVGYGDFVKACEVDIKAVGSIVSLEFEDGEKDVKIVK